MPGDRLIIIYESSNELNRFAFENNFVGEVQKIAGDLPVIHVDSFSDSYLFQSIEKGVRESQEALLIVLNADSDSIQGLRGVLGLAMKNQRIRIMAQEDHIMIKKLRPVLVTTSYEKLLMGVRQWISNPSASF